MVYQYHYVIGTTVQRFERRKATEAQSIQTNLKLKHVWNLISYAGTKLTFSCFSKPNPLPYPPTYKNPPSISDLTAVVDN